MVLRDFAEHGVTIHVKTVDEYRDIAQRLDALGFHLIGNNPISSRPAPESDMDLWFSTWVDYDITISKENPYSLIGSQVYEYEDFPACDDTRPICEEMILAEDCFIHCRSFLETLVLFKFLHEHGFKWVSESSLFDANAGCYRTMYENCNENGEIWYGLELRSPFMDAPGVCYKNHESDLIRPDRPDRVIPIYEFSDIYSTPRNDDISAASGDLFSELMGGGMMDV